MARIPNYHKSIDVQNILYNENYKLQRIDNFPMDLDYLVVNSNYYFLNRQEKIMYVKVQNELAFFKFLLKIKNIEYKFINNIILEKEKQND